MQKARLITGLILAAALLLAFPIASPAIDGVSASPAVNATISQQSVMTGAALTVGEHEDNDDKADAESLDKLQTEGSLTVTGTAGGQISDDDIFKVVLYAGESIEASLTGAASQPLVLAIYAHTVSHFGETPLTGVGPSTAFPLGFEYTAQETGVHYIRVAATASETQTAYALDLSLTRRRTNLTMKAVKSTLAYATPATLEGTVTSVANSSTPGPTSGQVVIWHSFDGFVYEPVQIVPVVGGEFSFTTGNLPGRRWYQASFLGNPEFCPSPAATVVVNVKAFMDTPYPKRLGTRKYRLDGLLAPRHIAGTYPVRIYLWRYVNGRYKSYGYKNARAYDYTDEGELYTRYQLINTFPYPGKWRVQAYHADALHAVTRTSYRYVYVR